MAYRLKPGRPVGKEIHRNLDKQLRLAIRELEPAGGFPGDDAVHEARRHVKKARAILRLVRSPLGADYSLLNERLRTVNRMLAPMADGESVVDTLGRLRRAVDPPLGATTFRAVRLGLVRHEARVDDQARANRVIQTGASLLRTVRRDLRRASDGFHGFRSVERGLRRSYRASRRRMSSALADPTARNMHAWRRRVKDHWLLLRLLQPHCANRLTAEQRNVEALDGALGEFNNCDVLEQIVAAESLVPAADLARWRRAVHKYRGGLRKQSFQTGRRIYRETPAHFVQRLHKLWRVEKHRHQARV